MSMQFKRRRRSAVKGLFGNVRLLGYGALAWFAFHLFVLLYEEPTLTATYPTEYPVFRQHVPRWVPRLYPWQGDTIGGESHG
jgi:protein-S-isoprenylcysteine O-methyltransferase Ste14